MTTDSEINDIWKRTDTNEIDALVRQMQKAAEEADHEIDGGRPQRIDLPATDLRRPYAILGRGRAGAVG